MPIDDRRSRRAFLQRALALGIAGAVPVRRAWTLPRGRVPQVLTGTDFSLEIAEQSVHVLGGDVPATAINGTIPGPELRLREGDTVTLRVTNRLRVPTSIHWHGLLVPAEMDGVPGLSFSGIAPGATYVYRFPVRQYGTYWYHAHTRFQEQTGTYGSIVIERRGGERATADRECVVVLSDWSQEDPERVFDKLKVASDFFNFNQPTVPDFVRDVESMGLRSAIERREMWNRMRMTPTDFSDVASISGRRFTYLINGLTASDNWTALFRPGERVRLRFINAAATTIYDVRIPGLPLTVVQADGQDVEPVTVDEFRISVAETYDVIVAPREDRAYTIFAQTIGRAGYARATLAPRVGMQGEVPAPDAAEWLTMVDMMGAMTMPSRKGMQGHAGMQGMEGQPGVDRTAPAPQPSPRPVHHARSEYGPNVDMHVDMPRVNLDDPGPNLRNNGRRVLTYADLHTLDGPTDPRDPEREIELHLTGHMQRFVWSFDGLKFSESTPVRLRYGERVRIVLVNDTMMTHPIHLHGMWSELETPDERFLARKHTVSVQPAQRVTYRVTADALGRWAFHCHLLYHMEAGMFREFAVTS